MSRRRATRTAVAPIATKASAARAIGARSEFPVTGSGPSEPGTDVNERGVVVAGPLPVVAGPLVVVVVGALRLHRGWVNVLVSSVTAPFRAKARPCTVAPVVTVIEVSARMLPTNTELVPNVAELPTCQNTLQACAALINDTLLPELVMRLELVWKIHTEFGLPAPSSTNGPLRLKAPLLGAAYTPPRRTRFVRSAAVVASIERPAALL